MWVSSERFYLVVSLTTKSKFTTTFVVKWIATVFMGGSALYLSPLIEFIRCIILNLEFFRRRRIRLWRRILNIELLNSYMPELFIEIYTQVTNLESLGGKVRKK
jgi:hypothetical protein